MVQLTFLPRMPRTGPTADLRAAPASTNWQTGEADASPAVGGAMDLATGAKDVTVMMSLFVRDGSSKLVTSCS